MASWRDTILSHFTPGSARLTLVSDPDGLLIEEGVLTEIKARGFDLIPFDDSIAFRYAYESTYRTIWDQGGTTDLVVVLHAEQGLEALPYDLLCAGRQLAFSLHRLFPHLNYPVVASLDRSHLDALYAAYQQEPGQKTLLGEQATKEFVLTHCFHIVPGLISTPVDLLKFLLSRHYQHVPIPAILDAYLLETLQIKEPFAAWPLTDILSNREAFFRFVQRQWSLYLASLCDPGTTCLVPFEHQEVRAYIDTLFLEGMLKPVAVDEIASLPAWVHVGLQHDPQTAALNRMRKLMQRCEATLPAPDALHRDWQTFARMWAELIVLRWELEARLGDEERTAWSALHARIEQQFAAWMRQRFGSLHNLPWVPQPVMVHHVPRYLAAVRHEDQLKKIALLVVDGFALDQWLILRRCIEASQTDWQLHESNVFAWVPTLTSVSRQALFAAEPPLYFSDSFETTTKEPAHWRRFWEDQGVSRSAVDYAKMIESGTSEALELCLGNPHLAILGLVVNTVDEIMHGEHQGTAGMHDAIRRWSDQAMSLLRRLLDEGFEVFLTADHGNVTAVGLGAPREGVLVEVGGKRARIYDNPHFRAETQVAYPDTIEWLNIGLPPDRHVLLPPVLGAFIAEGQSIVAHGGIALEEVIVPFVRITKEQQP